MAILVAGFLVRYRSPLITFLERPTFLSASKKVKCKFLFGLTVKSSKVTVKVPVHGSYQESCLITSKLSL